MQVSPVNIYSYNNINKYNSINKSQTSFCAKVKSKQTADDISENAQQGISVAKKMMKAARINSLNLPNIQQILNDVSPVPVNVQPIKNMPGAIQQLSSGKVLAHMLPMYNNNFHLAQANIYLSENASTAKEQGELIANTAHEFTHVLQRNNDKSYYGITKYTQNPSELSLIANTSQSVMQNALRECSMQLFGSPAQTGTIINSRLQNKYNIKDNIKQCNVNQMTDLAAKKLSIQLRKDEKDMKQAVTGWIKQETANETEAYGVTIKSLQNWGKYDTAYMGKMMLNQDLHQFLNEQLN